MITVDAINDAWGWTGLHAVAVLGDNPFGNLLVQDDEGRTWQLRPQDLACEPVARNDADLAALAYNQSFLAEWYMPEMVDLAQATLGPLVDDRRYCLKIPRTLGGEFQRENLAMVPLAELIRFAGEGAQQFDGLVEFRMPS
jgi:hypothetical protein